MIHATPFLMLMLCSCSMRSAYPLMGGLAGGAAGSLGGPVIGGLSAGAGVLAGEALKNKDALIEAEEKIVALSHGDVDALLKSGLAEHKTGFDAFTSYIKNILIGAAVLLGGYLAIPIFIAKRTAQNCSKSEAEKHMTRAPFPVKPPSKT